MGRLPCIWLVRECALPLPLWRGLLERPATANTPPADDSLILGGSIWQVPDLPWIQLYLTPLRIALLLRRRKGTFGHSCMVAGIGRWALAKPRSLRPGLRRATTTIPRPRTSTARAAQPGRDSAWVQPTLPHVGRVVSRLSCALAAGAEDKRARGCHFCGFRLPPGAGRGVDIRTTPHAQPLLSRFLRLPLHTLHHPSRQPAPSQHHFSRRPQFAPRCE